MNNIEAFIQWNYSFISNTDRFRFVDTFNSIVDTIAESYGYVIDREQDSFSYKLQQILLDAFLQTPISNTVYKSNVVPVFPVFPKKNFVYSGNVIGILTDNIEYDTTKAITEWIDDGGADKV